MSVKPEFRDHKAVTKYNVPRNLYLIRTPEFRLSCRNSVLIIKLRKKKQDIIIIIPIEGKIRARKHLKILTPERQSLVSGWHRRTKIVST